MFYVTFIDCTIDAEINCNCSLMVTIMPQNVLDTANVIVEI